MIRSYYIGAAGVKAAQTSLEVTSNNIANVSTDGYRPLKPVFSSLMYSNLHAGNETVASAGAAVRTAENGGTGVLRQTDRLLDFALTDENLYFAVETPDGIAYTRNGRFRVSAEADGHFLVTDAGRYVLDENGLRVTWNEGGETPRLGVFRFANESGLRREADMLYRPTETSGPALAAETTVKTGWLEGSAVDLTTEILHLMSHQRGFQMSAKMIQIADELTQTVNSLRA